jgi:hypothetical protein
MRALSKKVDEQGVATSKSLSTLTESVEGIKDHQKDFAEHVEKKFDEQRQEFSTKFKCQKKEVNARLQALEQKQQNSFSLDQLQEIASSVPDLPAASLVMLLQEQKKAQKFSESQLEKSNQSSHIQSNPFGKGKDGPGFLSISQSLRDSQMICTKGVKNDLIMAETRTTPPVHQMAIQFVAVGIGVLIWKTLESFFNQEKEI